MTTSFVPSRLHTGRPRLSGRSQPPKALILLLGLCAFGAICASALVGPVFGLGAVAAVGAAIVVVQRPVVGAYILVTCVPALSGLSRGLPVPGFRVTELMTVAVAAIVLSTARGAPRWGAFDWAALAYVVLNGFIVWIHVIHEGDAFTGDMLGTMFGPLQFFLLYRTVLTAVEDDSQRMRAVALLLLASVPVSIAAVGQQWDLPGFRSVMATLTGSEGAKAYAATIGDFARATGPFPHWHNLAGYLLLVLLLVVSLLHEPKPGVLGKGSLGVVLVAAIVALAQTASIAPMIGLVVGAVLIATSLGRAKQTIIWAGAGAIVLTVAFWSVIQDRIAQQYPSGAVTEGQTFLPQTIAFRWEVWTTQFLPVIRDNILIGYGPNLPPRLFFGYQESVYVTFLLRGGVILLLSYLALMATLALRARRETVSEQVAQRSVARAVFAGVILLLAIDTIANYFINSGPAPLLWTLAGLMGVAATSGMSSSGSRPPTSTSPRPGRTEALDVASDPEVARPRTPPIS
jgi:hypothetical protein